MRRAASPENEPLGAAVESQESKKEKAIAEKAADVIETASHFSAMRVRIDGMRSKEDVHVNSERHAFLSNYDDALAQLRKNTLLGGTKLEVSIPDFSEYAEQLRRAQNPKEIRKIAGQDEFKYSAAAVADVFDIVRNSLNSAGKKEHAESLSDAAKKDALVHKAGDFQEIRGYINTIAQTCDSIAGMDKKSGQLLEHSRGNVLNAYEGVYRLLRKDTAGTPLDFHTIAGFNDAMEKLREAQNFKQIKAAAEVLRTSTKRVGGAFDTIAKAFNLVETK